MPVFALKLLATGVWQGPKDTTIVVKVSSADQNVAMQGAVLSSANPVDLPIASGAATVKLAQGDQLLTVQINHVFPVPDWKVVGTDEHGVSADLALALASQNLLDPFSLNINLNGI